MSALDVALASVFADPTLSVAAIYRTGGIGPGQPIRAIRVSTAASFTLAGAPFASDGVVLEVRAAEVATPAEGDTIEVDGTILRSQSAPLARAGGLIWWLDVRPL